MSNIPTKQQPYSFHSHPIVQEFQHLRAGHALLLRESLRKWLDQPWAGTNGSLNQILNGPLLPLQRFPREAHGNEAFPQPSLRGEGGYVDAGKGGLIAETVLALAFVSCCAVCMVSMQPAHQDIADDATYGATTYPSVWKV
ncbi:hypothetical protein MKZ38_003954 [Zalerion maritima]|uniref:Uncharacterized protein n=1 Tax=Zalerion maritima TaxID=339359 RepID=A0AAD5WS10_9PEZI|nr:hypothetical protein MKZ38_003954 [Zalerion maritima]